MKEPSFEDVKLKLAEACEFLRSFTLGRRGFTKRDGIAGIQRLIEQCDRMKKLFSDGSRARESNTLVASASFRIEAAKARLALLRNE